MPNILDLFAKKPVDNTLRNLAIAVGASAGSGAAKSVILNAMARNSDEAMHPVISNIVKELQRLEAHPDSLTSYMATAGLGAGAGALSGLALYGSANAARAASRRLLQKTSSYTWHRYLPVYNKTTNIK
jgi:hypothetical protein